MKELIKITEREGQKIISARELYEFLEVSERFSKWFDRMVGYGLTLDVDYTLYQSVHPQNNQTITDYGLTIDTAKEIAMLQRSEKGKEARLYFIECEKQLRQVSRLTPMQILQATINQMVEHESRLDNLDDRVLLIESKTETKNTDYYTLSGYYKIKSMRFDLSRQEAISRGKALTAESKRLGYPIQTEYDAKYGSINCYHIDILKVILKF